MSIWIGFDPREAPAYAVARHSAERHLTIPIPVHGLILSRLREAGWYTRPTETRPSLKPDGAPVLWDVISDAPMATEFSNSRFLVPALARSGWALFMDGDVLVRDNLGRLFEQADPRFAVMCVKHRHAPTNTMKMDGQMQTVYSRKNWSSVCLFNVDHPANRQLSPEFVNSIPGRDLHAFVWLKDDEIGALDLRWNWLAGESPPIDNPAVVHHTLGSPCMKGYEDAAYSDEWRAELDRWAA